MNEVAIYISISTVMNSIIFLKDVVMLVCFAITVTPELHQMGGALKLCFVCSGLLPGDAGGGFYG